MGLPHPALHRRDVLVLFEQHAGKGNVLCDARGIDAAELERAELRDGEEEELLARRELLRNAEKFMDAFAAADYALSGGDDGLGAASQLKNAENALHSVRALGARFSELCERLESLYSDVYDLAETVRDLRSEMDFSPQELDAVESRADQLYRLKKKYGATVGEMLDYLERSKKELDEIEYADDRIVQLQGTLAKQEKEMLAAARTLSESPARKPSLLSGRVSSKFVVHMLSKVTPTSSQVFFTFSRSSDFQSYVSAASKPSARTLRRASQKSAFRKKQGIGTQKRIIFPPYGADAELKTPPSCRRTP